MGIAFSYSNLFSLHIPAWACILQFQSSIMLVSPHISTMSLYISAKFLLLFNLCILYKLKNVQAKITT